MKNTILKLMFAAFVIAFATSMLAVSCGKTAGGNNNNNSGNNSGDGGGGSGGCTGICPTTNLTLTNRAGHTWVKISGNTVTVNAAGLAGVITLHADADDDNRGFEDVSGTAKVNTFSIDYPGTSKTGLFFVSRAHVTKDTITMKAATTGTTGTMTDCTSSESDDDALARAVGGAHCRKHYTDTGANKFVFSSYLGTVFNNTKTTSHARGSMQCGVDLYKDNPINGSFDPITDTLIFNPSGMDCFLAVVNSAGGAATAEIDDAWVGDTASTTEVELHAIAIDVSGKTIPQWSDETGYNLAEFKKAHDNAKFKRLLQNNEWADLKFKVKIVTAANF